MFAQRPLGSPGGKECKSLGGDVWQKSFDVPKKNHDFGRDKRFFAVGLSQMDATPR